MARGGRRTVLPECTTTSSTCCTRLICVGKNITFGAARRLDVCGSVSAAYAAHHILSTFYPNSQSNIFDPLIQKQTAGLSADQLDAAQSLAVPIAAAVVKSRFVLPCTGPRLSSHKIGGFGATSSELSQMMWRLTAVVAMQRK